MTKFLLFLPLCFSLGCINLVGLSEYRGGWAPKEFHQNYLKFEIKNFKERKSYEPDRWFYKVNKYYFLIKWMDPNVYFPYTEKDRIPRSINPSEDYYIHKKDLLTRYKINQFLHGDRRDYFAYDCEYWMPLLPGKNQYKIFINDIADQRREGAEPKLDLPEGYSVRMKIVPAMRTLGSDPLWLPIGERPKGPELIRKGFEIEFTIEKNRPGEQEPVCDLGIES
ncbi:hypothetical protein [Leptospira dzoumogneensis]|uniref:Lipoprotein n=1 Tax=Leptospira dzoumogneensis TaxID=2484904 RepID=A0A4Z1B1E4_9LEPT|nr:hypothetical protein [Leptospira dzoumogneensis]TGN04024.1 hypothetical protein EHR06_01225 [Leptospira dzoumogneensis]